MKSLYPLFLWALLLVSCTESREPGQDLSGGVPLRVMAEILDYGQGVLKDVATTRTISNTGLLSQFNKGDEIGVFGIRNNQVVYDNVRYKLHLNGLWEPVDESGNNVVSTLLYDSQTSYFAYAPYSENLTGLLSAEALRTAHLARLNDGEFQDQSSYEDYLKADLLTSDDGVVSQEARAIKFTFTHAMSLLMVYYNGDYTELSIEKPASTNQMYLPDGSQTFRYIVAPESGSEVYGTAAATTTMGQGSGNEETFDVSAYWQAKVDFIAGRATNVTISGAPSESYKTSGVDMGLESGCIWSNHNLGAQNMEAFQVRSGIWYDEYGQEIDQETYLIDGHTMAENHLVFDRGDYYSWAELATKYEQPAIVLNTTGTDDQSGHAGTMGSIRLTGESYRDETHTSVTGFTSGSSKGYYPGTYVDTRYSYAQIDGNIAGSEHDVVRSTLWKGEWRLPNENEVDELVRNCDVSVVGWYYEDNVRYASWISERNEDGSYKNLNAVNSQFYGTENIRPYRYLVTIFKFESRINGNVLYFTGGTWTDWSIDMLSNISRDTNGNYSVNASLDVTPLTRADYGGMYYFASSASHTDIARCSYMEYEVDKTHSDGHITGITPRLKTSTITGSDGQPVTLYGLTQDGHRYTGMLIRPVYGGKNWNANASTRSSIWIDVE